MMTDLDSRIAELRRLHEAATPRAPYYAHPESDGAKATRAFDAALLAAAPGLLDALDAARTETARVTAERDAATVAERDRILAHANKLRAFYQRLGMEQPATVMIGAEGGLARLVREVTGAAPPHPEADLADALAAALSRAETAERALADLREAAQAVVDAGGDPAACRSCGRCMLLGGPCCDARDVPDTDALRATLDALIARAKMP